MASISKNRGAEGYVDYGKTRIGSSPLYVAPIELDIPENPKLLEEPIILNLNLEIYFAQVIQRGFQGKFTPVRWEIDESFELSFKAKYKRAPLLKTMGKLYFSVWL